VDDIVQKFLRQVRITQEATMLGQVADDSLQQLRDDFMAGKLSRHAPQAVTAVFHLLMVDEFMPAFFESAQEMVTELEARNEAVDLGAIYIAVMQQLLLAAWTRGFSMGRLFQERFGDYQLTECDCGEAEVEEFLEEVLKDGPDTGADS
jgi:hypothetical protein